MRYLNDTIDHAERYRLAVDLRGAMYRRRAVVLPVGRYGTCHFATNHTTLYRVATRT